MQFNPELRKFQAPICKSQIISKRQSPIIQRGFAFLSLYETTPKWHSFLIIKRALRRLGAGLKPESRAVKTSLTMKPAVPVIFPRGDFVFHPANPLFQMLPFAFQSFGRVFPCTAIPAAVLLFRSGCGRTRRIRFHQKRGQDIDSNNRPEAGTNKKDYGNCPDPKYRKVKIVGNSAAYTQYDTVT